METAKEDMNAEIQEVKEDFIEHCRRAEEARPDNSDKRKLQELESSINSTDNYLDSMKQELDKLDEMDVSNVELVKATFLYKGVGDSIINKLKSSILAAQNTAKTEQQKLAIKAISDSLFSVSSDIKWKENMFGLTNSLGASMIIYGLRTDLYNIGIRAINDK